MSILRPLRGEFPLISLAVAPVLRGGLPVAGAEAFAGLALFLAAVAQLALSLVVDPLQDGIKLPPRGVRVGRAVQTRIGQAIFEPLHEALEFLFRIPQLVHQLLRGFATLQLVAQAFEGKVGRPLFVREFHIVRRRSAPFARGVAGKAAIIAPRRPASAGARAAAIARGISTLLSPTLLSSTLLAATLLAARLLSATLLTAGLLIAAFLMAAFLSAGLLTAGRLLTGFLTARLLASGLLSPGLLAAALLTGGSLRSRLLSSRLLSIAGLAWLAGRPTLLLLRRRPLRAAGPPRALTLAGLRI